MSTRNDILDAFESLLLEEGAKAASLNAVAARTGMSKGGVLYHFASKDDMVRGILERIDRLVEIDLEHMSVGPAEAIDYFIRTSIADAPERQTERALQVLATTGNVDVIRHVVSMNERWRESFVAHGLPSHVVTHVMLVAEGLYSDSSRAIPALASSDPGIRRSAQELMGRIERDMDLLVESLLGLAGPSSPEH